MATVQERKGGGRKVKLKGKLSLKTSEILGDYRIAHQSRLAALAGQKEVMTGKAKFGIFGDGKEVAQVAMARAFQDGDFRAGYYRDQTFMFAAGMLTIRQFFAQLYASPSVEEDPSSAGRQMTSHFATRFLGEDGRWKAQTEAKNSSADLSPTGAQMARLLGLAYASKLYRNEPALTDVAKGFSVKGNEVAFGTIGNASTSEGIFFEAINAAGVLQVPMALSIWDDEYGISVPNEYQTTHSSISEALRGFEYREDTGTGFLIYVAKGWDYPALVDMYLNGVKKVREQHIPALFHVIEMTQPQGHSTSGSQERYKDKERLQWEEKVDCIARMRKWIEEEGIASAEELDEVERENRGIVEEARKAAWDAYMGPIRQEQDEAVRLLKAARDEHPDAGLQEVLEELEQPLTLNRKVIQSSLVRASVALRAEGSEAKQDLISFLQEYRRKNDEGYNAHLYSQSEESPLHVGERKPTYSEGSEEVHGRVIINRCFDHNFKKDPRLFAIGEDIGKLGGVNLGFEGLQEKYGELRVTDTGIRETTILGQGIGAAMRGLRPIVDIQYLDYFLFCLQTASDDLATIQYRTRGGQKAPVIIRTKGHRLEGIWHTGSPMGVVLHALRGLHICVPRNMTQAAGMYNTLFRGDDPALVVEVLSGYRTREKVPDNLGTFTVPLGVPEVLREGSDVTIATYGFCCRVAMEAAEHLEEKIGIDVEIIDVQTLMPFDSDHTLVDSVKKTNALLCLDEDVPGGAAAYMYQEILETQGGWQYLDAPPSTLAAKPNRSAYGTDGGYFTKPNAEDVIEAVYAIMRERNPRAYPPIG